MAKVGAVIFHLICGSFMFAGLYDVLLNYEENQCQMSYMYEVPQYKRVPLPEDVTERFSKYALYLYGEGQYFEAVSSLRLSGIPVLYIPGNGGSMKQARSVGSFLLRKAEEINWDPHFNVFSVDLNEELVAFYGATLNDQVTFVQHCIEAILRLYESKDPHTKPKSVVLVGHSMGGMIARGVLTSEGFDPRSVNTIFTLATPHVHPVVSIDTHIASFYNVVNQYWKDHCEDLKHITMVSVSGGDRDFQVHGASAKLQECSNTSISTFSTAVPRAWVSAEHQTAVWCKQVVLATTRSLFDMVDPKTHLITDDPLVRWRSVRYHFERNAGLTKYSHTTDSKVKVLASNVREDVVTPLWSLSRNTVPDKSAYYVFNVKMMADMGKEIVVLKTTTKKDRWLLACAEVTSDSATDLSKRAYLTPQFKVLHLELSDLLKEQHNFLLVSVAKHSANVEFAVNFLHSDEYKINITVPHVFSNLWTLNRGYLVNRTIGDTPLQFYHTVTLHGMESVYHAHKLSLHPKIEGSGSPLLELQLPEWSALSYGDHGSISVKRLGVSGTSVPIVHVYSDGATEYAVNIKVQFVQILGQIIRFHGVAIPAMIVVNIMLAYSYQMKLVLSGDGCLSTSDALTVSASPYKIQPFTSVVRKLYMYEAFLAVWHMINLPVPDAVLIDDVYKTWFTFVPLVIFLYANAIVRVMLYFQARLVGIFGWFVGRFFPNAKPSGSSLAISMLHTVILAILASLSGSLSFLYITLVNFLDLVALSGSSQGEEGGKQRTKGTKGEAMQKDSDHSSQNGGDADGASKEAATPSICDAVTFQLKFSMHSLWLCLAALSLPSLVAFIKGYSSPTTDPMLAPAIFASVLFILHKQQDGEMKPSLPRRIVCRLLYPLTILCSLVCLHSMHRLPYFILVFMSFHVALQYFG